MKTSLVILVMCWYGMLCKPMQKRSAAGLVNTTAENSVRQSTDTLLRLLEQNFHDVIIKCNTLLKHLETSQPRLLSGQFSYAFQQLILNPIGCKTYQIVERMLEYRDILNKFQKPMDEMVSDIALNSQMRQNLLTASSSYDRLLINQIKLMEIFQGSSSSTILPPNVNDLQNAINSYLANNHPHLTEEEKKEICIYNFITALKQTVKTIYSEYNLAIPFSN